ncbi:hypothetical protein [Bacteroides acidifaciens]|uniref:hypothetical protein n=1 Tax=Bacteroides acidifaciens TaxID=85831 RepID=UPI00263B7D6B|nr:hypothetical protein [Bacteroides acidifaciens]
MDTNQMTDEERRQLAEKREQMRKENGERFAGLYDLIAQERKETIKLMQRRHAYYTKLINEAKVKTAQEFYDNFKDHFEMYGIKLELSDDKSNCSIYLELGDYDYEQYWVEDGLNGSLATVSPNVAFKDCFTNLEVNIFTGEYL